VVLVQSAQRGPVEREIARAQLAPRGLAHERRLERGAGRSRWRGGGGRALARGVRDLARNSVDRQAERDGDDGEPLAQGADLVLEALDGARAIGQLGLLPVLDQPHGLDLALEVARPLAQLGEVGWRRGGLDLLELVVVSLGGLLRREGLGAGLRRAVLGGRDRLAKASDERDRVAQRAGAEVVGDDAGLGDLLDQADDARDLLRAGAGVGGRGRLGGGQPLSERRGAVDRVAQRAGRQRRGRLAAGEGGEDEAAGVIAGGLCVVPAAGAKLGAELLDLHGEGDDLREHLRGGSGRNSGEGSAGRVRGAM